MLDPVATAASSANATEEPLALHPTTTLLAQQLCILSSLILDSVSSFSFSLLCRLLGQPALSSVDPKRSVVVVTGTGTGLARDLAMRLAAAGWHVFVQAPGQIELSGLLLHWQRLKSRLAAQTVKAGPPAGSKSKVVKGGSKPGKKGLAEEEALVHVGTLIPLVFASGDSQARTEAVRTVRAYVRENGLETVSLINTMDPSRAARATVGSSTITSSSSSSSNLVEPKSPGTESSSTAEDTDPTTAKSSKLSRRRASSGTSSSLGGVLTSSLVSDHTWREVPLPLSISTDSYMFDLERASLLSTVSITQDFLPLLRATPIKGRVINVWAGGEGAGGWPGGLLGGTGPIGVTLDGFRSLSRTLGEELEQIGLKVALVLPGSMTLGGAAGELKKRGTGKSAVKKAPLEPTVSVTNDVRSILTIASDPSIRAHFDSLLRLHLHLSSLIPPFSDAPLIFRSVRSSLNDPFPRSVYPVGLDSCVARWVEESVPVNVRTVVGSLARRWAKRWMLS